MSNEYDFSVDYGLGGSGEGLSYEPYSADTYDYSFDDPYKKVDYSLGSSKDSGEGLNTDDFSYSVGDGFRYTGGSQEGLRVQDFDYSPSQGITYNKGTSNADLSGSGLINTISKLVGNLKKEDIAKMLAAGWTIKDILAGRKARQAASIPAGKWTTPELTATRTQIQQPAYQAYTGQGAVGRQSFTPTTYAPKAAEGGIMGLAAGGLRDGAFVIPADVVSHFGNGSSEAGLEFLAKKLGATPIKGKGDGMSDSIDTTIEGQQPAKVANEEAIVSPEKVAALGKGDPKKGAKVLYAMMDRVRHARTGTKKQGKQITPEKFAPGGIAGYAGGGAVAFVEGGATTATTAPINTNIAAWATPYVQDYVSKGFAMANAPYQAYTGPLTAGTSPLQQQAFTGYQNYKTPTGFGTASNMMTGIAGQMGAMGYSPAQFGSQYSAPAQYQAGQFANQYTGTGAYTPTAATAGFNAPGAYQGTDFTSGVSPQAYQAGQFANQFQGPAAYQTGQFATGLGGVKSVEEYMTPYLQGVTGIEAREARRQSDIDRIAAAARLAQAGGYGGSRQAIMEAEGVRNLQTQIGDIQAKGLQSAYDRAQAQRLAESQASMEAQRAGEASRQFGSQQGMTAAQLAAQYGTTAQQMGEESRQFGATQGMQGLQMMLDARRAAEASKQFGASQAMTGAQLGAQFGLQAQQQTAQERQFGAQQGLASAQSAAQYGLAAQQAAEQAKQYGYGQQMSASEQKAQYALAGQRETEASKQFGAKYGLDALLAQSGIAQGIGQLAGQEASYGLQGLGAQLAAGSIQRGTEAEKIAADRAQFDEQRAYDLKMQQYKQSLLRDLPIEQGPSAPAPTLSTEMIQSLAGLAKTYPELKTYFEGMYGNIFGTTTP